MTMTGRLAFGSRQRAKVATKQGSAVERAGTIRAIVAWAVGLLFFFPVFYLIVTGFKTEATAVLLPPQLFPIGDQLPAGFTPTLENYKAIFDRGFGPYFLNSIIVVTASSVLIVALALPCAYALVWRRGKRSSNVMFFFLSTKFLPAVGVIIPIFIIARDLRASDNLATLVVMYTAMNLAIAIWLLRSFFDEIPRDVIQAARVDGANLRMEMQHVAIPMIFPGLVATVFICIIFAWNEFFFAVNLMATKGATVPMFMIGFVTSEGLFWAKLAAAGTLAMMPVVVLGWLAQKQLVRGLSMGAVK
jgi:sorbitol/mannitol transport system permease protein